MGLHAIAAAREARRPLDVIAAAPSTSPEMAAVTRAAGMRGWEGELCRRAAGLSLEEAVVALRWWPAVMVRTTLATGRARPTHDRFLDEAASVEGRVAASLLGAFPYVDELVAELDWLLSHADPDGRPQFAAALRRGVPDEAAPRVMALAQSLVGFRDDCAVRAWERLGVTDRAEMVVRQGGSRPEDFGWDSATLEPARLAAAAGPTAEEAARETDVLAADPWETMTESRRTRALGVVKAAADRVEALPR